LTSALNGVSGHLHALVALPQGKSPLTHTRWICGSVGSKACLDAGRREKCCHCPCRQSNPSRQARSL